jgi:hypothetical protein
MIRYKKAKIREAIMLASVSLMGLYAILMFWAIEAIYVLWQARRNDALPSIRMSKKSKLAR